MKKLLLILIISLASCVHIQEPEVTDCADVLDEFKGSNQSQILIQYPDQNSIVFINLGKASGNALFMLIDHVFAPEIYKKAGLFKTCRAYSNNGDIDYRYRIVDATQIPVASRK